MIFFVILFSLVLRLISLNQSLWLDEATTALVARMPIADFFSKFMPADFHPPLYYLFTHYWSLIFGISEVAIRTPSVIFGVLTVYFVYKIANELKQKWPIVPALFLATSGLHIYYSQEARMYMMATFLVTVVVYLFLKKKWILFSIFLSLLFLTDYLSIIILLALIIYVILFDRKKIKSILLSILPLMIVFISWLPFFIKQLSNGITVKDNASNWWNILGPVTFKNLLLIPTKFIIGRISIDDKTVYAIIILILVVLYGFLIIKAKNKLVWSWLAVSLILGISISFFIPTLTYFRYLFILPAFYLLLSEKATKVSVILILLVNIVSTGIYLANPKFKRENWRDLANYVGETKIVLPSNSQKEALIYYQKTDNIIKKEELTTKQREIYLSRYVWDIFDSNDTTRKYIEKLGYNKESEINFNGVILFKYAYKQSLPQMIE